jgi:hypothetical protein
MKPRDLDCVLVSKLQLELLKAVGESPLRDVEGIIVYGFVGTR